MPHRAVPRFLVGPPKIKLFLNQTAGRSVRSTGTIAMKQATFLLHCCGGWGWCPLGLSLGDQLLATPTLAPDPGGAGSSARTHVDRKNDVARRRLLVARDEAV